MAIQIAQFEFDTSPATTQHVSDKIVSDSAIPMTLSLMLATDPASAPGDLAYVYPQGQDVWPWFVLSAIAPSLTITCQPSELWVAVKGADDVVQAIAG